MLNFAGRTRNFRSSSGLTFIMIREKSMVGEQFFYSAQEL
jgi:hypothetical protein